MRYAYDCEFLEDGKTIELISLGMVAEDGREFYAVNSEFRWQRIARRRWYAPWRWKVQHQWLLDNVVPSLPKLHGDARLHMSTSAPGALGMLNRWDPAFRRPDAIKAGVLKMLHGDPDPQLWADYGAYDHVALCQLWGRMIDLPYGRVPMFTNDFRQALAARDAPEPPEQPEGDHNALADARWLMHRMRWLDELNPVVEQ